MKRRGKYDKDGRTYITETDSISAAKRVYQWLDATFQINGWSFYILDNGMPESMYMKRDGYDFDEEKVSHIMTDVPSIILRNNENPSMWYLVVSGEDKYQETKGNAIERFATNFNAIYEKACFNSDICPYVLFVCGIFIKTDDNLDDYLMSKFRKALPYGWLPNRKNTSYKREWNCIYLNKDLFSEDEKFEILKKVAEQSVNYLKSRLEISE